MKYQSWSIGDITVTKLVEMEATVAAGGPGSGLPDCWPEAIKQIPWLIPNFADAQGHLHMSIHALLVQTPDMRLIVDTCVGNDKVRQTEDWHKLSTGFLDDMAAFGWTRESVDGVLCTHLHVDHVGWNTVWEGGQWRPTFPNARYYMARKEFDHWASEMDGTALTTGLGSAAIAMMDTAAVFLDSIKPVFDAGLVELVDLDAVIAPGVRLLPTTGHTPGHVSVILESGADRAVITGDMMHHPCQIARPEWASAFDYDAMESEQTRQSFMDMFADTPTLIIGTHFGGPTAGRLVRGETGYWLDA